MLAIILLVLSLSCAEMNMIDEEIKRLTDQKNLYRGKAEQQEDVGQRLQFEGPLKDEARQAYKLADQYRKRMVTIQEEIDLLEKKKHEETLP